jgi:predicted ATPase/DNA-binding SARP family transcriptional activator
MRPELRFALLGQVHITRDREPLTDFISTKAQALLCYLAVTGRTHQRPALAGLLWGEMPEKQAKASLRVALSNLRKLTGSHLRITRYSIAFDREQPYWLDVEALQLGVEHGDPELLRQAIGLYQGDFLAGFYVREALAFEEWTLGQRERLRALALRALDRLVTQHMACGEYQTAIDYASRLLALEPWLEKAHRQMMLLLARTGQHSAALNQYQTCRRLLAQELGIEPTPETNALYERIKAATSARPHNLPPDPTPFIGRAEELAAIQRRLADPTCRLLTIVGAGGVGKSSLAIQAARRTVDEGARMFLHGVTFVSLASVESADLLVSAIASALDLAFRGQESPEKQLLAYLREKEMLLLLDNYEQLLPETQIVADIVEQIPDVKLLVTSRERLNLREEWLLDIDGLPYPSPPSTSIGSSSLRQRSVGSTRSILADEGEAQRLREYDAVRLFEDSARRVQWRFSLVEQATAVVEICRLVGGLPLAIELSAAWLRTLSCSQVLEGIEHSLDFLTTSVRNVPAHHRNMRAVFEHSWRLMNATEQQTLRRLSVFRGGFICAAAQEVARATLPVLDALVNRSVLRAAPAERYELHELFRQYAGEKLLESGETESTRQRHLAFFVAFAEEADPQLRGVGQQTQLNRLQSEYDNLRAALQWAFQRDQWQMAARLAGALGGFWAIRGYLGEGRQWLDKALAHRVNLPPHVLAKVLFASGWLAFERADYEQAKQYYQATLDLFQELGDTGNVAQLLNRLGHVAQRQKDHTAAVAIYEQSLALYRALDDRNGVAMSLNRLGHVAQLQGDQARAIALIGQSLALRRELGDQRGVASSLNALAEMARQQGNYRRAAALYREALILCRQLGDKRCVAGVGHNLGHVAQHRGEFDQAADLFKTSLSLYRELENWEGVGLCLSGLAGVVGRLGALEQAARLFGAVEALLEADQVTMAPVDRLEYERNVAQLRAQMDEGCLAIAWDEGRAMPLEQVMAYALDCPL